MEKVKVLIADDSEQMRDIMREILSADERIEIVGEAENGLEACQLVRMKQPDVLLLDMVMPQEGGMYVLERLMNVVDFPKRPCVLVVSAVSKEKIVKEALRRGAEYYFVKPFAPEALLECVKGVDLEKEEKEGGMRVVRPMGNWSC